MKELKFVPDADYYDEEIVVYDLENGKYLVRDSRESIQFQCTKETLDNYDFSNDFSFFDDVFYEKLNAQNNMELEGRSDGYYVNALFIELERIANHCSNNYYEFLDK